MTPFELILDRLQGARGGGDQRTACCPGHDDRKASLSIRQAADGRVLLKCHAGCTVEMILNALGLAMRDLFPREIASDERGEKCRRAVAAYNYRDERGELLYETVRFDPKGFSQRRPRMAGDDEGALRRHGVKRIDTEYVWSLIRLEQGEDAACQICEGANHRAVQIRCVLYRLPELLKAGPKSRLFVVEGEKDADRLRSLGLVATTNPQGAGKWRSEYAEYLRKRMVGILHDNDETGRKHAQAIAVSLVGIALEVRIVELAGLPPKGDVSDWLDQGGTKDKLISAVEQSAIFSCDVDSGAAEAAGLAPLDIFGDTSLLGSPTLARAMLPEAIGDFAWDEAARLGVDPAMIAMPALVAIAAAIDDSTQVQPKEHDDGWKESPRLWVACVAEPGAKKTPSLKKPTQPLREIEQEWIDEDSPKLEAFEIEMFAYRRRVDEYLKKQAKGGSGELPRKPRRPRQRRIVTDDFTIEALADILIDNPRGVLCVRDELSGWFGSFDAYRDGGKEKDRALWLELYNGGAKPIDRVKSGRRYVPNWSASLIGGIQPGPMRRLGLKIPDDGLVQRFIIFFPRDPTDGEDRVPDRAAVLSYRRLIVRLAAVDSPRVFHLSQGAQKWRRRLSDIAAAVMALPDTSAAFKAHLDKWNGLFARLVLVFHLAESAGRGNDPDDLVSEETAVKVFGLMTEFLLPNAARFYTEILGREQLSHARWIAGLILSRGVEKISARDIGRAHRELRGDEKAIQSAMQSLHVFAWVTPLDANGKPPSRWSVDPRVHSLFAARAEQERSHRHEEQRRIREATARLREARILGGQE